MLGRSRSPMRTTPLTPRCLPRTVGRTALWQTDFTYLQVVGWG